MDSITIAKIIDYIFRIFPLMTFNIHIFFYLFEKNITLKKNIFLSLLLCFMLAVPGIVFAHYDSENYLTFSSALVIAFTTFTISTSFYVVMFRKLTFRIFSANLLTIVFYEHSYSLIRRTIFSLKTLPYPLAYCITCYILIPLLYLVLIYILKKINFKNFFNHFFKSRISSVIVSVFLAWAACFWFLFRYLFPHFNDPFLLVPSIFLILISLFLYLGFYRTAQEKVEKQASLIIEQQKYLKSLEHTQNEMRIFQHNQSNTIAALYLHAHSGDNLSIKKYIDEMVFDFDSTNATKIRQTTNLANIFVPELKNLLLSKLIIMEQQKINFDLEVVSKVEATIINTAHFITLLDIIIDNAIEANSQPKKIKLVISNEEDNLVVIVSNQVNERPLLSEIWKEGYSTKSKNRGYGLVDYQEIINNYPHVYKQTLIKNSEFMQILKIQKS